MKKAILQIIIISGILFVFPSQVSAANHDFTGLPLTEDGWTDFETITSSGYESARVVFVDATGGNDGMGRVYGIADVTFDSDGMFQMVGSLNTFQTIRSAYAQMRPGYPDIILLKRGETWSENFITEGIGRVKAGESPVARHIIASYGSHMDRPAINGGTNEQLKMSAANYTIVAGIKFFTNDYATADKAFDTSGNLSYVLIEDCLFSKHYTSTFGNGSSVTSYGKELALRRNVFTEFNAHDGFIYTATSIGIYVEENVFHLPHDTQWADGGGRIYYGSPSNTEIGLQKNYWRGNILYGAPRGGIDGRGGGHFDNNLLIAAGLGLRAVHDYPQTVQYDSSVTNNVFTQSGLFDGARAVANLHFSDQDGTLIDGNIFVDGGGENGANRAMVVVIANSGDSHGHMVNVTVSNNIIYDYAADAANSFYCLTYSNMTSGIHYNSYGNKYINNDCQDYTHAKKLLNFINLTDLASWSFSGNRYYSSAEPESGWFNPGGSYSGWQAQSGDTSDPGVEQVIYPDPNRTVGSYYESIGGTNSTPDFLIATLGQSRQNWNKDLMAVSVNNYIRIGFGFSEYPNNGSAIRADVDGSLEITTTDALLTLRNSLGLSMTGTAWQASSTTGDVNCDGVSNSTDALLILRYSLGLSMSETGWCE